MRFKKKQFKPSQEEILLLEKLRRNPKMIERIEPILDMADDPNNSLDAHQAEELLIEEIRQLGNETLTSWAKRIEEQTASTQRSQHKKFQQREKKTSGGGPGSEKSK